MKLVHVYSGQDKKEMGSTSVRTQPIIKAWC